MSELILFSLNAIIIYLLSDWILRRIESSRGEILPQRQIIFFAIFLVLALLSFTLLRQLMGPATA
jgi:surface polysaccharide O-acyltransferase-like enzyme